MYIEIGILVAIILSVSLFYNVYDGNPVLNVIEDIPSGSDEGFSDSGIIHSLGKVDLREERQKLLDELSRIDVASHEYSLSKDRSSVRIGLERMIAEIDRALETDGRYLTTQSIEAILRSGRQSLI